MKLIKDNPNKGHGFTIIELLTVMSIIILLISLLVPALTRVRRYALRVKQKAQFHSISIALDLFNAENDGYPDSNELDDQGLQYCGAMKLCEAMVGQDLKGFSPKSRFERRGFDWTAPWVGMPYPPTNTCGGPPDSICYTENIRSRKMYLQLENANAYQLASIWTLADIAGAGYDPCTFVLCDVYNRVTDRATGKKMGMPILYYKAHPSNTQHKYIFDRGTSELTNIYDRWDNGPIVDDLPLPWVGIGPVHPMARGGMTTSGGPADPEIFYNETRNEKVPGQDRPYREDSFILMSAGFDGEYGTSDDVFNFGE